MRPPFYEMFTTSGTGMYLGAIERAAAYVRKARSQAEAEAQVAAMRVMLEKLEQHLQKTPLGKPTPPPGRIISGHI